MHQNFQDTVEVSFWKKKKIKTLFFKLEEKLKSHELNTFKFN